MSLYKPSSQAHFFRFFIQFILCQCTYIIVLGVVNLIISITINIISQKNAQPAYMGTKSQHKAIVRFPKESENV